MNKSEYRYLTAWNGVIILSVVYLNVFVPLDLIFDFSTNTFYKSSYLIIQIIYFLDIFVNMLRYRALSGGNERVSKGSIRSYCGRWMIIDILAAIPFDLILGIPFLKIVRLIKVFKVANMMYLLRQRHMRHAYTLRLVFFGLWFFYMAHWISCGWLGLIGIDPLLDEAHNYINGLYWCITTLTAVGYGDIVPGTMNQKIYTIFVEITGIGLFGYLIGNIASIISKRNPAKLQYLENMEKLSDLLHYHSLPMDLQGRIRNYFAYMRDKKLGHDETGLLDILPYKLREEVAINLKKDAIHKIPLFKDISEEFITEVIQYLESVVITPGEFIFRKGDIASEMYFIVHGELVAFSEEDNKVLSKLSDGDFFGEIALFRNKPRVASIKARTYCDLYKLEKKHFQIVVDKFPEIADRIEQVSLTKEYCSAD